MMEQTIKMIPRIDGPLYSKLLDKYYCRFTFFTPNDRVFTECRVFNTFSEAQDFYDLKVQEGYWTNV